VLEEVLGADPAGVDAARELARLSDSARDVHGLELASARLAEVVPFEADAHLALGRLALARGDAGAAVQFFGRALATGPGDPVAVRTDLAEGLLGLGRTADAKREVIAALEDAPRYERAQGLLLKIVDGPGSATGRQR
jgi:Flp pilus assembly protein TadD